MEGNESQMYNVVARNIDYSVETPIPRIAIHVHIQVRRRCRRPRPCNMSCGHHHQHRTEYPALNYTPGNKWIKKLTKDRLNTFVGGHFSDVNLSSMLFTHRLSDSNHVKLQVWSAPGLTKPSFEEALKQKFMPAKKGDSFGPSCASYQCDR